MILSTGVGLKPTAALSESLVDRVTTATHTAMACFVLVLIAAHALGFHFGWVGDLAVGGLLVAVVGAVVVAAGRGGQPG